MKREQLSEFFDYLPAASGVNIDTMPVLRPLFDVDSLRRLRFGN